MKPPESQPGMALLSHEAPANPVATTQPENRYLQWALLSDNDRIHATNNLGYDQNTWNNPGTADVEAWSYHDLYEKETVGVLELGMDDEMWDCHVNHYYGYWWEDIEYYGYDLYFSALGWDVDSWDNGAQMPKTEDMYWDELSLAQQAAATQLCYFRDLWDSVSIPEW